jgi:hypothetical protein
MYIYLECWSPVSMLEERVGYLFTIMYIYWSLYILGLRSSWGTSRARPAWSLSRHILTPALSPYWGTHARSHALPEEVVYSLSDSCWHFTQRLFPPTVPYYVYWTSYYNTRQCTHTYYTSQSHNLYYTTLYHTTNSCPSRIFISSALRGRLAVLGSLCSIH